MNDLQRSWAEDQVSSVEKNGRERKGHILHKTIHARIPKHRRLRIARCEQKHEDGRQYREYRQRELAATNREPTRATREIDDPASNKRAGDAEDRDDSIVAVGLI